MMRFLLKESSIVLGQAFILLFHVFPQIIIDHITVSQVSHFSGFKSIELSLVYFLIVYKIWIFHVDEWNMFIGLRQNECAWAIEMKIISDYQ